MRHTTRAALVLTGVITGACREWPEYAGAFDVPHAMAVLQPEVGGPFTEPVAFVGNLHGGQIFPLALKNGRFLTDDPTVAFLRANPLAAGQLRVLAGLSVVPEDDTITVLAADRRFRQILEIPYSTGIDAFGAPIEPASTVTEPVFEGSGQVTMEGLEIKVGWASTEDWVVEFAGAEGWSVTGSRSGRQRDLAVQDEPYVGVRRAVAFTLRGEGQPGDRFTFSTDAGLVEHDAGGVPLEMRASPDLSAVALVTQADGEDARLRLFDARDPSTLAGSVALAVGSPGRLAWSEDGTRLFAADSRIGAWEIDVATGAARFLDLPFATSDVAPLDGEFGDLLFVTPTESKVVWVVDLTTGSLRDVNPWTPGVQGMQLEAPIAGIEAMPLPYLFQEDTDAGVRRFERAVAVSVSSGRVVFASERDGCLVTTELGPRTNTTSQLGVTAGDYTTNFDDFSFGAFLEQNAHNSRHVLPNPCGGITRAQSWVLDFDTLEQAWRVEGSLSGVQSTLAREDERYVSDDGEISFVIRAGGTPSQEGWRIQFSMIDGLTSAEGDNDGDGSSREVILEQPGDPVYFHYTVGRTDQGWRPVDDRPFVLLAGQGSDRVGRVMPQEGMIDASWD